MSENFEFDEQQAAPEEELPPQAARDATMPRARIRDKNFFIYIPLIQIGLQNWYVLSRPCAYHT